ncbi:TonB-dependent receptor [Methylocystis sp. ATCC 49242]|uniref:TonB-dependent receptor family protein n=1 Tax=Methylocystis sp. ATCC 49242 TaxID=622637 RepID=UPI0001F88204|nr:TonB-dependent receptor [Methylocystis sp. ATCC 49242]
MTRRLHLLAAASANTLGLLLASSALAQQSLPTIDVGGARGPARQGPSAPRPVGPARVAASTPAPAPVSAPSAPPGFSPRKLELPVYRDPTGQTFTTVSGKNFVNQPLVTVRELLQYSPGVSFKMGNGPRDVVISIRGSSARNGFGVRNIVMLEDGFSVTQPDGLSRTDLTDPHAYAGVDVYRGPSSALFGNFANGGAINFRTRTGAEIDGVEIGSEFGSFGYLNNFTAIGKKTENVDIAIFASDVRGDGWTLHNRYDTQTVNATARWQVTPNDLLTFKFIHNQLYGDLSSRLSLNQYYNNPFQVGCYVIPPLGSSTPGGYLARSYCGGAFVPLNGLNGSGGAGYQTTAYLAGFHRNDRRDVLGLRWEHDFDANTKWRTQVIYDDKNIIQPTGATAALQDEPAVNASTDITQIGTLGGYEARHFAGLYFNRARYTSYTNNTLPVGNGASGALQSKQNAMMQNLGARGREEVALSKDLTMVLGLSAEMTKIAALQDQYTYVTNGPALGQIATWRGIPVNKTYWNFGPEASVTWQATPELRTRFRASSGYGTPNPGQLFVTSQGRPGANVDLKTQRNTGIDIGFDWNPDETLTFSLTGFHEWYQDEQLTQSPGAGLLNYTFNAPGSVHRGVETQADWRPLDGWRVLANYTYNNQIFTDFTETLGTATQTGYFNRAGYKIPGVAPHNATARLAYDHPHGDFKGLGAFVEYNYQSSYFIDNGNVLTIPGYGLVNANVHFDREIDNSWPLKHFTAYFEVRNIFDNNWVASANNISNTVALVNGMVVQNGYFQLAQFGTGSIYAGNPRLFQGGVKFKF